MKPWLFYPVVTLGGLLGLIVGLLTIYTIYNLFFGPVVIRRLTARYLFKRRLAWVSLAGVMLCTTMVLVVYSVMGGWLAQFRTVFQGFTGDVVITSRSMAGFGDYEKLVGAIEKMPECSAAVPVIRTFGLINFPDVSSQGRVQGVQIVGIPIERVGEVNTFPTTLHRQYERYVEKGQKPPPPSFDLIPDIDYRRFWRGQGKMPGGMIASAGVLGLQRDENGKIQRWSGMYTLRAITEVIPLTDGSIADSRPRARNYFIVDDSRTKFWQFDQSVVYVPFNLLQEDLDMGPKTYTTDDGKTGVDPARTTELQVNVRDGFDVKQTCEKIKALVTDITGDPLGEIGNLRVETWYETQATYLSAVENEVALVTSLFALISLVAVFLVFVIFYMIVVEKTRDIGIVKSVGATNGSVAGIFLGYGAAIGIAGSLLGVGLAWLIVTNINEIHHWMGQFLGLQIWNPKVYMFDKIPNHLDPATAAIVGVVAVVSSIIGALIPAIRAARMNPVEALRFE